MLGLTTVLFSCASIKYKESDKWIRNNTITINSENLKEFSVQINSENTVVEKVDNTMLLIKKYRKNNSPSEISRVQRVNSDSNKYYVLFDGFKNKSIGITLFQKDYEPINLKIEKRIRYDALTKDVFCSIFTFGLPFLIDPFKSDFYRIKKSSLNHKVRFEFTQEYMKSEYVKIQSSTNIMDFKNWLSNYPRSVMYQKVVDHRDSLEFSFALKQQKESAIDDFISTHNKSKFLESAITVKNEMKAAKDLFESSKINNTIESYEDFLKKFPNSLHVKEARKLLVDAAEKEAFSSFNSEKVLSYLKNYLIPNEVFLDKNIISEKRKKIKNNLEDFIFQESVKNNQSKVYEEYASLWKRYVAISDDNQIPSDIKNFEKIQNHQVEICDLLFNSLKEADSKEKQIKWKEKSMIDFPKLDLINKKPTNVKEILFTVLDNQKKGNGLIKIFGSNYLLQLTEESKNDNGLISKFKSGSYNYKEGSFNSLTESNYQELNFKEGIFSGISKAFKDKQLLFSFEANKNNEITDEISYFQNGKLVKTTYISKGFTADGECIIEKDFSYEFEDGVNLTLINFEKEITKLENESKNNMHSLDAQITIKECERLIKYNIPDVAQNARIEKVRTSAEKLNENWNNNISRNEAIDRARLRNRADNNINKETENNSNIKFDPSKLRDLNETDEEYNARQLIQNLRTNTGNSTGESDNITKNIKSIYCVTMKGQKYKVILYETGECDYVLFNIFGEMQKSLSGKWTMRNLGFYGGWTITIELDNGSFAFQCQMNGNGDIQALNDNLGNIWLKCI